MSNPDLLAAIDLVVSWNAAGWGEYVCWDVIQGIREKPFVFFEPLTDEQLMMLMRLRDEHKIWFFHRDGKWKAIDIDLWRKHTEKLTADDVCRALELQAL